MQPIALAGDIDPGLIGMQEWGGVQLRFDPLLRRYRIKNEALLNAAYSDAAGVTAQFNLNLSSKCKAGVG